MRTPLGYYGGKQRLIKEILPLIPPHSSYCEAFVGGGALYFSKPPSENEAINDLDERLINFYRQAQTNFPKLQEKIQGTLHSESDYELAKKLVEDKNADPVDRAWAYWVSTQLAFSFIQGGGFAFGSDRRTGRQSANKRDEFTEQICERLKYAEIFCRDAIDLIKVKDREDTVNSIGRKISVFFFLDPPYFNSDMGHYDGYTEHDFINLLETLKNIKGKFLLTSYPSEILNKYRKECGWRSKDIDQIVGVTGKRSETKKKTECITYNYEDPTRQPSLFDDFSIPESEGVIPDEVINSVS